jgi:predicted outer membrane lipoprotein
MDKSWLKNKVNVDEVEKSSLEKIREARPDWIGTPLEAPFGAVNDQWLELKEELSKGGELWYFESEQYSWMTLCGRAGYCIVRDGEPGIGICTRLS